MAQAAPPPGSVQPESPVLPGASTVSTNATPASAAPRKDGLKRLEEDLSRSFQPLTPKSSLDGLGAAPPRFVPPVPRMIPNRRVRDELERRKNWFMNPEAITGDKTGDENGLSMSPFGSEDRAKKNSLDDFFEKLNRQRRTSGKAGSDTEEILTPRQRAEQQMSIFTEEGDKNLPNSLNESAQRLKKEMGEDYQSSIVSSSRGQRSVAEFLGLSDNNNLTKDQMEAHKDYLARYQQLLDGAAVQPTPANPLGALDPVAPNSTYLPPPTLQPVGGYYRRDTTAASSPAAINNVGKLAPLSDLNASVNQWNPFYTPLNLDPPKPAPPLSSAPMEMPRRRF